MRQPHPCKRCKCMTRGKYWCEACVKLLEDELAGKVGVPVEQIRSLKKHIANIFAEERGNHDNQN